MLPNHSLHFPPFRLDLVNQQLWRDTQKIHLRRKTLAVLRYLAERPGQLVTKEELLAAVWPQTYVSDVVPMVSIRELRKALGDDAKTPRFIQTVHRQGFRFIRPTGVHQAGGQPYEPVLRPPPHSAVTPVGREGELGQLQRRLERALSGERQMVFVTGEPGIGKTTLVETFLHRLAPADALWTTWGQCIECHGVGEAFLPLLEALRRLCRAPGGGACHGAARSVRAHLAGPAALAAQRCRAGTAATAGPRHNTRADGAGVGGGGGRVDGGATARALAGGFALERLFHARRPVGARAA